MSVLLSEIPVDPKIITELPDLALFNIGSRMPIDVARVERRYLTRNPENQLVILKSWASKTDTYHVKTIYLDTPNGTWTKSKSQTKFRLRNYNDEEIWWMELKSNINDNVQKHRRRVELSEIDHIGLVPVVAVSYRRTEFESPESDVELRMTVDSNLECWKLPKLPVSQIRNNFNQKIEKLHWFIIETKGPKRFPSWLPLSGRWSGSKSRWSLAMLSTQ